jgi:hypothetical protein
MALPSQLACVPNAPRSMGPHLRPAQNPNARADYNP